MNASIKINEQNLGSDIFTIIGSQKRHPESPENSVFAVRVKGSSMSGVGIMDGSILMVDGKLTAQHGDIIIANLPNGAVLKRLSLSNNIIALLPENPAYSPTYVSNPSDLKVIGVVVASIKNI